MEAVPRARLTRLGRPVERDLPAAAQSSEQPEEGNSAFECNICYELAHEPVVTLCGHLYCWPCIYRWMQVQSHCRVCPVCKAGIDDEKSCIPIYGRGGDNSDPRKRTGAVEQPLASKEAGDAVPRRPSGQRPAVVQVPGSLGPDAPTGLHRVTVEQRGGFGQGGGNANMQPGLGIIPTLFGFQQNQGQGSYSEPLTPEQQHQAFLSRLLLMLGSFVIMCLLLF